MAASDASKNFVQKLFVAYFGRPAAPTGLDYFGSLLDEDPANQAVILDDFWNSPETQARFGELSVEGQVTAIFQQLFGRDPAIEGLTFWSTEILAGRVSLPDAAATIADSAAPADLATFEAKVAAADKITAAMDTSQEVLDYQASIDQAREDLTLIETAADANSLDGDAALLAIIEGGDAEAAENFVLTAGTDSGADFRGSGANDRFEAPLSQNEFAGGVSNTLSSADVLDGSGGQDSLMAQIVNEFIGATSGNASAIDIQPTITNIETIEFEARDLGSPDGEGGRDDQDPFPIVVDAKDIKGHDTIGSWYSDGDLIIENLTTIDNDGGFRNTDALTVSMKYTDNFNSDGDASDLTVYFDEDFLLTGQTNTVTQANYWLLDEDSSDINAPLLNIERNGVSLTIDGEAFDLIIAETAADVPDTWEGFAAALQAEINQRAADGDTALEGLTVEVDDTNLKSTFNDQGVEVDISAITIFDPQGRPLVPTGFLFPEDESGNFDIFGRFDSVPPDSVDNPLAINVDLEKVGRNGEGGNLKIQGKDGETIDVFNIDVIGDEDLPNSLGQITSSGLGTVNIETATESLDGDDFASLTVRGDPGRPFGGTVDTINAASFLGDLIVGTDFAALNVNTLTATGGGDVTFVADIVAGGEYSYVTGDGEDDFTVDLDGNAVDALGESLSIVTGDADDSVDLTLLTGDGPNVSQLTMEELKNISISTGDGDDEVDIVNSPLAMITTGDGSDFVEFVGGGGDGTWTVGQPTGPQVFGERVLYEATLTVTYAGFESTVAVETDAAGNFIATQDTINDAIIAAIEANPEQARLLETEKLTGTQQLQIDSVQDGLNDLEIRITQPELVEDNPVGTQVRIPTASSFTALVQGIIDTTALTSDDLEDAAEVEAALGAANFGGAAFDGNVQDDGAVGAPAYFAFDDGDSENGGAPNFSIVDMGDGSNDLIVLDPSLASSNILRISEEFGKVSVVNFHDLSPNNVTDVSEVGNHALDFTTYLDGQVDPSTTTNTQSAQPIAVTLNTNNELTGSPASTGTALANSVNVLGYNELLANSISFSALTGGQLLAALNGDAGTAVTGGLVDGDLDAVNSTPNLIGTTQDHIVMVQNDQNPGEYKVFHLTSEVDPTDGTEGEFATADLLGVLDFGNSINFNLVGNADYATLRETLLLDADVFNGDQDAPNNEFFGKIFTVAQAQDLFDANGVGAPVNIVDTQANILAEATQAGGSDVLTATGVTITMTLAGGDEDVTFGGLSDSAPATSIDFTSATAVSLTQAEAVANVEAITGATAAFDSDKVHTDADVLAITNATPAGIPILAAQLGNNDDSISFGTATLDQGQLSDLLNISTSPITVAGDTITVTATAAADTISGAGESADFVIDGGADNDVLTGGLGDDVLAGGDGNDSLDAGPGDDTVTGGDGDDTITIGTGDNTVNAGSGTNTVNKSASFSGDVDTITHDSTSSTVVVTGLGPATIELVASEVGATVNAGTNGTIDASSSTAATTLNGSGATVITGGSGNDTIDGGAAADVLTGGAGADEFVYDVNDSGNALGNIDVITDFEAVATDADSIIGGTALTVLGDSTGTDVSGAVVGSATITADVTAGVITLGGADAGMVDTFDEWVSVAEALSTTAQETSAFEFEGSTYLAVGDGTFADIIELAGVTGVTVATAAAADTVLIG